MDAPTIDEDDEDYDALKSWLTGEEDSFSEWLGEETFEEEREEIEEELAEKEEDLERSKKEVGEKMQELDVLRSEFEKRLQEIESGELDVEGIIDENTDLKKQVKSLEDEISTLEEEREELKNEIQEIKQGSVAMLKYLKTQKMKDSSASLNLNTAEYKKLKEENRKLKAKIDALKNSDEFKDLSDDEMASKIKANESLLDRKEREIKEKNQKIKDLKDELEFKEEELEKIREQLTYKEDELNQREEDLMHRQEVIKRERMELENLREELGGTTEKEMKRRLEELEKEISRKEEELKAKEKYLSQKERELRAREEDLIDEELEEKQEEILREIKQEKCKTGTGRLDDLLMGGIPLGSNVSIYGPPHVGKRVMINSFIAEGIEKGVPAIWVITDTTVPEVREEMKFVLPTYEEYEARGLVYYVDAYSLSMGEDTEERDNIAYIEGQANIEEITKAVEKFAKEIKKENRYYRMAFISVSTLIAYLDTSTTFRTLQPFSGRRKKDKAVTLFTLEKGMHSQQDISMLGHMMDGEIEFKFQQLKTFLRVEGLGDVQTRDWVRYTSSKSGITMGSFSLDTIR